jgi:Na+/melibiose symporter-like transporter
MATTERNQSIVDLLASVIRDVTGLFQSEIRLVRSEISEKVSDVSTSVTMIAAGGLVLFVAIIFLLLSLVRWLAVAGIPDQWGYLIVGVVVLVIGAIVLMTGIQQIRGTSMVPDRALRQAREDLATVKEHLP